MRSVRSKMGAWIFALLFSLATLLPAHGEQCGSQARGALCPGGLCCSQYGWCGTTTAYCGDGCQSQCGMGSMPTTGPPNVTGVDSIITQAIFNQILTHRNEAECPGKNFYTYDGFISAANSFSGFGTTGDSVTRKRELAAFLAQTSRETTDTTISFMTAIWFWMTPQSPKPSPHDVMTGRWKPSCADVAAGRQPGFGVVTNIFNGRLECGKGIDSRVADRIGFYKKYCDLLGVSYGANLDCYNQRPFSSSLRVAL